MRMLSLLKRLFTGLLAIVGVLVLLTVGAEIWRNRAYTRAKEMRSALKVGQPVTSILPLLQAQEHDGWHLFGAEGGVLAIGSSGPTGALKEALEAAPSGRLSVMLIAFVFHRFFVNVDFEERAITKVWLSELD